MLQNNSMHYAIPNAVQPLSGIYSDYELTTLGSDERWDLAYRCSKLWGQVKGKEMNVSLLAPRPICMSAEAKSFASPA